jgi:hypothetical protein
MRMHARRRAIFPSALAVSALLAATLPLPLTAQSGSDEHALFVSAFDRSGAPVDNLGPDAFIVKEDGAAREVLRVARATEPIAVTVIVDTSQAASGNTITQMRTALPTFIDALTPEHAVSLVGLADRPTILVPFTRETAPLTKSASGLFALRNTGATLLDALFEVSKGLASRDYDRAAIVAIVAEGPEHTNRYSKDVVAELKKADRDGGLGDIAVELFATPAGSTSLVWGVGPIFSIPTATVESAKTGSWGLGPAAVVVWMPGPWVIGTLATQVWTFADYGDGRDVNQFLVQPFINYNIGKGWALVTAPIITANWDAPSGDEWTVPLGGGLSWTTKIGGQAMNLGAQYYNNVEHPSGGAENQLRFVVSFLFPAAKHKPSSVVASP